MKVVYFMADTVSTLHCESADEARRRLSLLPSTTEAVVIDSTGKIIFVRTRAGAWPGRPVVEPVESK